jgi:hypothetical protein
MHRARLMATMAATTVLGGSSAAAATWVGPVPWQFVYGSHTTAGAVVEGGAHVSLQTVDRVFGVTSVVDGQTVRFGAPAGVQYLQALSHRTVLFGSFLHGRWITPAHPVTTDDGVTFHHGVVITTTTNSCSGWTGTDYVLRGAYRTLRLQVGVPEADRCAPQASWVIVTGAPPHTR